MTSTSNTNTLLKTATSWETIFSDQQLIGWGLPSFSSITNQGYARGVVLKWTEIQQQFRGLTPPPNASDNIWYIVCDVLILDDNPIINDELYIFARRIEIKADISFIIPPKQTSATIVTQEIVKDNIPSSIEVSFIPKDNSTNPINVTLTPLKNKAATIFNIDTPNSVKTNEWKPSSEIISNFGDNLANGSELRQGITSIFQIATLLSYSSNKGIETALSNYNTTSSNVAINQLAWVGAIASVSAETLSLSGQARTQMSWVIKKNQGLVIVPPLDFSIYNKAAASRVEVLKSLYADYEKWVSMEVSNENWLTQAKLVIGMQANEVQLQTQLEERAKSKLKLMQGAQNEAGAQLTALQNSLVSANFNFEAGVKIWKRHKEISAAFKLIVDTVKLGVAVGELVAAVAAPETAAGEGGESSSTPSQFDNVKKLAGPVGKAGGATVTVIDDVNKIIEIGKNAEEMDNMANDTLKKVESSLDKTFTVSPLTGIDVVTGGKQIWESLRVTMDDVFTMKESLINQIDGGPEFRVAFRELIIGGESYCATRLAVAEATNKFAETKLYDITAKENLDLAKNNQKVFEQKEAFYNQMQQNAFNRMIDAKRSVYIQLEQFEQARYYFTLEDADYKLPSITSSVEDFIEESAKINSLELILDELNPIPQDLTDLTIDLDITTNERNDDKLIIPISIHNPVFDPYARVRIDKINIDLLDSDGKKIIVKSIVVGTSGYYNDIVPNGGNALFSGNPYIRTITYDSKGKVELSSNVYSRFQDVIFKPTPFANWTFKLPTKEIAGTISKLSMTITGAASPKENQA